MVPDLDYNLQGTFRERVFYEIGVPLYPFQYEDWDDSWCFSLPDGMNPGDYQGDEYFRIELANTPVLADFVDASLCPLHFLQKLAEIEVEVHDGPLLNLISCDIWIAMKKSLRRILEEETCFSGLKSIKPKRITHFGNEYHDNGCELFDITVFEGRIWDRASAHCGRYA